MKKYLITLLFILLLLTGCGSVPEQTTKASTEELTTESKIPEEVNQYIDSFVEADLNGTYTVSVDINNAGHMAEVADYVTKAVDGHDKYDVLISYKDPKGWVCTWHSYDNKTGILINTLTNYTEENVTVDRLYEWNNQ